MVDLLLFESLFLVSLSTDFFPSLGVVHVDHEKKTKFSNDLLNSSLFL